MANDPKARIKEACEKFFARQLEEDKGPARKNGNPEKEVETECLTWMRARGWDVNIFEAKATYDSDRDIFRQQSMKAGIVDCIGNMDDGHAVYIEFKAKGKLSNFTLPKNHRQQDFILRKVNTGAFACVVDSAERLENIYNKWRELREHNANVAIRHLLYCIPKRRIQESTTGLFADDDE